MDIKATPQHNRFRRIILPLIVALIIIAAFSLVEVYAANQRSSASDPFAPYDPATYEIPEIVVGYRILAVQTADNTACMMPTNAWRVLIQPVDPMPNNPMVAKGNGDVIFELKKLRSNVEWEITYSTPSSFDRAQFAAINQSWNKAMENGCLTTGPMIPITDTPDPFAPYAPATFGIPEILAGYRILAIRTADNTACMKPDIMEVVVQAVDPMPDNLMVDKGNGDVIFELKKLYPDAQWSLGGMGPVPFDREQFVAINENWNKISKNGCPNFGGPIILVTETPDPFAAYAPATFGLPEIVAGYRIVAVHSSGNTSCMPVNMIRLTIQAVDPSPDNPMVDRHGGDIIFEVKKLHPDIDWQLDYVMPGRIAPANRVPLASATQQWIDVTKEGCLTLGGPEFTLIPIATP